MLDARLCMRVGSGALCECKLLHGVGKKNLDAGASQGFHWRSNYIYSEHIVSLGRDFSDVNEVRYNQRAVRFLERNLFTGNLVY